MAKKNSTALTDRQREELGKALRAKRAELLARQKETDEEQIFEVEPDPIDMATGVIAGNDGAALSAHDTVLLGEIDSALLRLTQGRYGLSEESGEPIPYQRLRSIPWARRTAEEEEEASESRQLSR